MEKIDFNTIEVGTELPSIKKDPITQIQLVKYAGASGDFNQIHTVPEYAKEAGLNGTIAHGMLIMGIAGQLVTSIATPMNVKKYSVSFKSMTLPGDIVTAKATVKKKYEKDDEKLVDLRIYVVDEKDDVKLDGKVTIKY